MKKALNVPEHENWSTFKMFTTSREGRSNQAYRRGWDRIFGKGGKMRKVELWAEGEKLMEVEIPEGADPDVIVQGNRVFQFYSKLGDRVYMEAVAIFIPVSKG